MLGHAYHGRAAGRFTIDGGWDASGGRAAGRFKMMEDGMHARVWHGRRAIGQMMEEQDACSSMHIAGERQDDYK
jgi:hypothetical protein